MPTTKDLVTIIQNIFLKGLDLFKLFDLEIEVN